MIFEIILKGNVQKVGCRYYCGKVGAAMKIPGSASNLLNGSVRVLVKTDCRESAFAFADALRINKYHLQFFGIINSIEVTESNETSLQGDYTWK